QEPIFADDLMAFGAFSKTNTDFRRAVFLPTEARSSITATRQAAASVAKGTVGRQKLSLETQADGASLVVIAQTWYPSWKGYIDGQPARIWRANYAFQALEVPGGNHHVELVYEDTPFRLGTVFSILGSALCLALLLKPTKSAFPVAALS
ncbi:MAG TPA: hypothetical protein VN578_04785, partial [Candidatus Binatia bacterium]|nr:hypothetical protein [Candidatus Binatia bacterium]